MRLNLLEPIKGAVIYFKIQNSTFVLNMQMRLNMKSIYKSYLRIYP